MSIQNSIIPSINARRTKITIAVPTRDMMHSHFAYCLQAMVKYHATIKLDTVVEFELGTLIGTQREKLVTKAYENDSTHILWLDSDMMFPYNICQQLLSHNLPFVACNYSTRSMPFKSVAYEELHDWDSWLPSEASGLIQVKGVGLGCALVNMEVFDKISKPYFPITYDRKSDDYLGEDMNFCLKVDTEAEYPIVVDADASKYVYHVGMTAFSINNAPVTTG